MMPNSIQRFLSEQHQRLQSARLKPDDSFPEVHVVLGNESADLDSIVSAIAHAYHLSRELDSSHIVLPYINIPREQFALRRDAQYLFELFGLSLDDVSFVDDSVTLAALHESKRLKLHLVDHNELKPDQSHLGNTVVDIIDHHLDSKKRYPLLKQKKIRTIGSCASLIAEALLEEQPFNGISNEFASFLLAPILIDTLNLQSKDKTTESDVAIVKQLTAIAADALPGDYYETLLANKSDVTGFTKQMLLLKDFKKYRTSGVTYGMSSLVSAEGFTEDHEEVLLPELEAFSQINGLDFLVLLMPHRDAQITGREIVLFSRSQELLDALSMMPSLNTQDVSMKQQSRCVHFYTSARNISRKAFRPSIVQLLEQQFDVNAVHRFPSGPGQ